MDFADDLALLSHTQRQMQVETSVLNSLSETVGLRVHPGKSRVLRIGAPSSGTITVEGKVIENAESFCYLDSIIDKDGGTAAEIKSRIGKAQVAFCL